MRRVVAAFAGVCCLAAVISACSAAGPVAPSESCSLTQMGGGVYAKPAFATVTFQYQFSASLTATLTSARAPDQNQLLSTQQGFVHLILGVSGPWDVTLTTAGGCIAKVVYCNGNCG